MSARALELERFVKEHPKAKGAVLGGHGLNHWGNSAREGYEVTLSAINKAVRWFAEETRGKPASEARRINPCRRPTVAASRQ